MSKPNRVLSPEEYQKQIEKLQLKVVDLEKRLVTDDSMQIFNRQGLMSYLEAIAREVDWQQKHPDRRRNVVIRYLSILFLDIDYFKAVNDEHGHAAGDMVLRQLAALISDAVRDLDIVGRYGGEEVVVGLVGAGMTDAQRLAEQLRSKIEAENFKLDSGATVRVTVSIGVAELTSLGLSAAIHAADEALYNAKETGRNKVVVAQSKGQVANFSTDSAAEEL